MSIDDVIRDAVEALATNAARDVDRDKMFRSLQQTRARRRVASNLGATCVLVLLAFGVWTVTTDARDPQTTAVAPAGLIPSPTALPGAGDAGVAIPAGSYAVLVDGSPSPGQPRPVIRVPAGYRGHGFAVNTVAGDKVTAVRPDDRGLSFWAVQGVFTNPCTAGKHAVDPGPSVSDLARALATQPLRSGTAPVPVTVAGYQGLYVETSVPAHIDFTKCKDGYFDSWTSPNQDGHYQQGPGEQDRLWILNVNGSRLVIDGWHMPGASQQQINQITQMVYSLTFQSSS